jgi:ribosomal protein S16
VAIKGKTKRSQGRPMRRPATAPRAQIVERRQPWYRATAFPVTLAVIVLAITLLAAWNRAQMGWGRDDVRRFGDQVRVQTDQLNLVLGTGTKQLPGMASAADLASGKVKPKDFQVRASGWSAKIDELSQKVANITVGAPQAVSEFDGTPINNVGGHVPMLTSVRDAYTTAFGFYSQAANTYQNVGGATTSDLQQKLLTQAQSDSAKAASAMDAAASLLARVMVQYHLPVNLQLPGESSTAFGNRTGAVSQTPGLDPNTGQPLDTSGQVPTTAPPAPPTTGATATTGNP